MGSKNIIRICAFWVLGTSLIFNSSCKTEDDDPTILPLISVESVEEVEGNSGTVTLSFKVRSNEAAKTTITFDYATEDGTAVAGEDYEETSGSGRIETGQSETFIDVTVTSDTQIENDENFKLVISNAANANIALATGIGTIINDEELTGDEGYTTPMSYPDYTLVWADEFEGTELNTADWNYEVGDGCPDLCGWGNSELQSYREGTSNAYLNNGKLILEAKQESANFYTSARITTQGKQFFKYGRIDIRAKLPKGQGMWPALWMLGESISTVGWPSCGEIDIMEIVGHEPGTLHGTAHWDNSGQHAQFGGSTELNVGDFSDEFHVFTIIWDEQFIRWFLDDNLYHTIDITPGGLSEFQENHFFIFNIAVGGNWPGNPNGSTVFPQKMFVDYIRVFQ